MQLRPTCLLLGTGMLALPALVQAQPTAHYVPGVEGIKAASLPRRAFTCAITTWPIFPTA